MAVATQQSTLDADLVKRASHVLAKAETKDFVLLSRRGAIACAREERKQIRVDLVLVRRAHAVRQARIVDFDGPLDEPGRLPRRNVDRHDLIVLAVHEQSRDIELLQVVVELGLREGLDAFIQVLEAALHAQEEELVQETLRDLSPRAIGAVERDRELLVELRTIIGERGPYPVELLDRQTLRIGRRLHEDRRHRGDQHGL